MPVRHPEVCFELTSPVGWGPSHNQICVSCDAEGTGKLSERCQSEEASPATVINSDPSACIHQMPGKAAVRVLIALAQEHVSETLSPVDPLQGRGSCMFSYCGVHTAHVSKNVHRVCSWDEK